MDAPFRIRVHDKTFSRLFTVADPVSVSVTPRHLAKGTGSISLPITHPRADAMLAEGVRVIVEYRVPQTSGPDQWVQVMSGPLWTLTAQGPVSQGLITFGLEDDYRVLSQILAWPLPSAALTAQTVANDVRSGNAETVIKAYAAANATRLGIPLSVAANLNRGTTVKGSARFTPLSDLLPPLATAGGLGITVRQQGAGLVLDVYQPLDRTARVLTESAGTLTDWSLSRSGPTTTRVVVGGQGEGTARQLTSTVDATVEALWGTKAETFLDSRDTGDGTTLAQRGTAAIAEGAPQAGWSVTVAETDVVRYGRNLNVGDRVAASVTPTLAVADVLSECTLTWSADAGLTVAPQVGDTSSSLKPDALLARAVRRLATGINQLRTNR